MTQRYRHMEQELLENLGNSWGHWVYTPSSSPYAFNSENFFSREQSSHTYAPKLPMCLWRIFIKGIKEVLTPANPRFDGYTVIIEAYGPNNSNPKNKEVLEKIEKIYDEPYKLTIKDDYGNIIKVIE